MDNLDCNAIFGEWICSIISNPAIKSFTHTAVGSEYEQDYILVTNLCSGFGYLPKISIKTIEGAKERYKQFNKSLLELSRLSDDKKNAVSAQIDLNAENLKQQWICTLQQRGIDIKNNKHFVNLEL